MLHLSWRTLLRDTSGASTLEYGVGLGLIALVSLQALSSVGGEVSEDLDHTSAQVKTADMLGPLGKNGADSGNRTAEPQPFDPDLAVSDPYDEPSADIPVSEPSAIKSKQ
jgi:Flp pilus assembly pilin Flp